jgi:hypothetical protein
LRISTPKPSGVSNSAHVSTEKPMSRGALRLLLAQARIEGVDARSADFYYDWLTHLSIFSNMIVCVKRFFFRSCV